MEKKETLTRNWLVGKYQGETFIGRYFNQANQTHISIISKDGKHFLIRPEEATVLKPFRIRGNPSTYQITAPLQKKKSKTKADLAVDQLLNHVNTY